ncbi:MAG: hypothetical protein AB8G77_16410 [Rhodothermales bacterium]
MSKSKPVSRRNFLQRMGMIGATSLGGGAIVSSCTQPSSNTGTPGLPARSSAFVIDDFERSDSFSIGNEWESMNPGYWEIKNNVLRRRLTNEGDKRPGDWFPWHYETHRDQKIPIDRDPSLPFGMIWRRDWQLSGNFSIRFDFKVLALPEYAPKPANQSEAQELQTQPGYGVLGLAFGSSCLHESWTGSNTGQEVSLLKSLLPGQNTKEAAWMALVSDDANFGFYSHLTDDLNPVDENAALNFGKLKAGAIGSITLFVAGDDEQYADISAILQIDDDWHTIQLPRVNRMLYTNGYFGLVARGLIDFEVSNISLDPGENLQLSVPTNELQVCYPLGDTLTKTAAGWQCKFISIFRNHGQEVALRISDTEFPAEGWANVPVAAVAPIVTNNFRRNTAVLDAQLPYPPDSRTLYYTVWKDGVDVTEDLRIGSNSVGPGTGFIGKVPRTGQYIGRLPQLVAPYKICGLSCHSIHKNNPDLPDWQEYQSWYVHDQPTPRAFQHLESYDFQVMLWEDDVWYLELMFAPPSTDDAYKVINTTIAGPTTRWQMMRHWNVINPGDHDFGMDDVKGPEQLIVRKEENTGQDPAYMRRNFQIVQHLISGDEAPDAVSNPKNWRKWRMPAKDFSIYIMDARLWRTSQDTRIWDDEGWGHLDNAYDRANPTRTLLGEEQFSWLEQQIKTDASPLVCVTGINGLHTIWSGVKTNSETGQKFEQRDRVVADYAGWVKAASDRVLNLLGSREGITTVYGDVHNGCIMVNKEHRLPECCFGPIGRGSGRSPKEDFGERMEDYDGRTLRVYALYHADYESPSLRSREGVFYWNFLQMEFNPQLEDPNTSLAIRNLVDPPDEDPRGGSALYLASKDTGRRPTSALPATLLIPDADVQISTLSGELIRGTRTGLDGTMPLTRLNSVMPQTPLLVTAYSDVKAVSLIIQTSALA